MQEALYKPVDVEGPNGLWGFFNTPHPNLTASKDGYLVTVAADEAVCRLDDFTPQQERAFWDFTFAKAVEGLNDPAKRGFSKNVEDTTTHTVMVALNDGPAAWQGVGTLHGHVIWAEKDALPSNICERLIADRTKFAGNGDIHLPVAMGGVGLSGKNYADDIRTMRRMLRESFADAKAGPEDIGFSLYTAAAYPDDPRRGGRMLVELWTQAHHPVASLSQWTRYWNGLWDKPVSGNAMGLQYKAFRPEPLKP